MGRSFAPCIPALERGCVTDQPQRLGSCCDWLIAQSRSVSWVRAGVHPNFSIHRIHLARGQG